MKVTIKYAKPEKKEPTKPFKIIERAGSDYLMTMCENFPESVKRIKMYYNASLLKNKPNADPDRPVVEPDKSPQTISFPDDPLTDALESLFFNASSILLIDDNIATYKRLKSLFKDAIGKKLSPTEKEVLNKPKEPKEKKKQRIKNIMKQVYKDISAFK